MAFKELDVVLDKVPRGDSHLIVPQRIVKIPEVCHFARFLAFDFGDGELFAVGAPRFYL